MGNPGLLVTLYTAIVGRLLHVHHHDFVGGSGAAADALSTVSMIAIVAVACGGAVGAALRYGALRWCAGLVPHLVVPWGTLAINLLGCFLVGLLIPPLLRISGDDGLLKLFLVTGVLGGFTTFSAFSVDTLYVLRSHHALHALLYVGASVVGCILVAALGMRITGGAAFLR